MPFYLARFDCHIGLIKLTQYLTNVYKMRLLKNVLITAMEKKWNLKNMSGNNHTLVSIMHLPSLLIIYRGMGTLPI